MEDGGVGHTYALTSGGTTSAIVGSTAGPLATLKIFGSNSASGTVSTVATRIGDAAGSNGSLQILDVVLITANGSTWSCSSTMTVGQSGTGQLHVDGISLVSSNGGTLGLNALSSGAADIDGAWDNSGSLIVGSSGNGTLTVGGSVTNTTATLGSVNGSSGNATVTGTWTNTGSLTIGNAGMGTMNVTGNGTVTNTSATLASQSGSSALVTLNGANADWQNGSSLTVGGAASATINVNNSAQLSNTTATLGNAATGAGTINVNTGGDWASSGLVTIGSSGGGTLAINNGTVSSLAANVASSGGSLGNVTVSNNGTWTITGTLSVGLSGTGTMAVQSDGDVSNNSAIVGGAGTNSNMVTVKDAGSTWTNLGAITLGNGGHATLNVQSGGAVTSASATIGSGAAAVGSATVTGTGSTWMMPGALTVGASGSGLLTASTGGSISNGETSIASFGGSTGQVRVSGSGTTWNVNGAVYVGGNSAASGGTGTLTIESGGTANISGSLKFWNDGALSLSDGTLTAASVQSTHDAANWTGGTLNLTAGGLTIDANQPLGNLEVLSSAKHLNVALPLVIGDTGSGSLSVTGGTVQSGGALLATATLSTAFVEFTNAGSSWTNSGSLVVANRGTATLNIVSAAVVSNTDASAATTAGSMATIDLASAGTQWNNSGSVHLGGSSGSAGGGGTMTVASNAAFNVAGLLKVWNNYTLNLNGGAITAGTLDVAGHAVTTTGTLSLTGSTMNVNSGGLLNSAVTFATGAQATITGVGSTWTMPGSLSVGAAAGGSGRLATLTMGSGTFVNVAGSFKLLSDAAFVLAGGMVNAQMIDLGNATLADFGTLVGNVKGSGLVTATGALTMGNSGSFSGFQFDGQLDVGSKIVTLQSATLAQVGTLTSLSGGTLVALTGVALPVGHNLIGSGAVNGRIAAALGSTINASGDMNLGDATAYDGYYSDGLLQVNRFNVTLNDKDRAVLGSLSTLGDLAGGGHVIAAHGYLLEAGKTVVGRGTVTGAFANQGFVQGTGPGPTDGIRFDNLVTGSGDFGGNITFAGGFSPGNSPAQVDLQNYVLESASTLTIEIGGPQFGSQFDRLDATGTAMLGGALAVDVLGAYAPVLGDAFKVLTFASHSGNFASYTGLGLAGNMALKPLLSLGDLTLKVGPALDGDANLDGVVDIFDINTVSANWATDGPLGDVNLDGVVDIFDINVISANWGNTLGGGSAVQTPEPSTFVLFGLAAAGLGITVGARRRGQQWTACGNRAGASS